MQKLKIYFSTIFKHFFGITTVITICLLANLDSGTKIFAQSTFSKERLENAIINYVKSVNKCESDVEIDQSVREQRFTQSGVQATINHQGDLTGLCKVNIDFLLNGEIIRSQEIRIKVKLFVRVPVAIRFIPKDAVISAEDVEIRRADVTNIDPNTVVELSEAIGAKSRSGIARGNVIKYSDLMAASSISVKKGDRVRLLHYAGAICIKSNGFALENGSVGSVIKVKNQNNQTLFGFVADDGNVIIEDSKTLGRN